MWMKIVGCLIFVIILNCEIYICSDVRPTKDIKISKNITIYRNGYGRLLGLLSYLKGFHHAKHIYHPLLLSKLWRASFELELRPHSISENELSSSSYFTTDLPLSNSGVSSNNIESIFHFGNNEQQSSITIGGSNQIVKGPDERDEIPIDANQQNHLNTKETVSSVILMPPTMSLNDEEEKSERVVRQAIRTSTDEQLEEDEDIDNPNTTPTSYVTDTADSTSQSSRIPPTPVSTETVSESETTLILDSESTIKDSEKVSTVPIPSQVSTETAPESETTLILESESTIKDSEKVSTVPIPSQWLGYYDYGVHKPEFIEDVEFTTIYPSQLVTEDIRYFTYEKPFKPSLPDYSNSYYSNFFVPLRYFKR